MEFDVKANDGLDETKQNYDKSDFDTALDFSKKMKKELGDFIKAIVLFGSSARKSEKKNSDIDILVIIDDLSVEMTAEIVESYRLITEKIVSSVSDKLHITSLRYMTFWQYARDANPVAVNILRDGVPILDTGFITPLQQLLKRGEIKPSIESIYGYFSRSSAALVSAKRNVLQAALDLYWAAVDASHSLLMMYGKVPPSPEHVADMIEGELLPKHVLTKKHVELIRELFHLSKIIEHNELKYLSGKDFDHYYRETYDLVTDIKKEIEKFGD
ncbi:MAG: nucleotidyltransferase domain-containing protein [Candidatus Woesearchaeota archaeon]